MQIGVVGCLFVIPNKRCARKFVMYIHDAKFSFVYLLCQYDIIFLIYSPIIARQDWVAVLTPKGEIVGYVQGDGF